MSFAVEDEVLIPGSVSLPRRSWRRGILGGARSERPGAYFCVRALTLSRVVQDRLRGQGKQRRLVHLFGADICCP